MQQLKTPWTVSDFYIQKQIILSALGWGMIPTHLIKSELDSGSLGALPIQNFEKQMITIQLLRKAGQPKGKIAEKLWNWLQ